MLFQFGYHPGGWDVFRAHGYDRVPARTAKTIRHSSWAIPCGLIACVPPLYRTPMAARYLDQKKLRSVSQARGDASGHGILTGDGNATLQAGFASVHPAHI